MAAIANRQWRLFSERSREETQWNNHKREARNEVLHIQRFCGLAESEIPHH